MSAACTLVRMEPRRHQTRLPDPTPLEILRDE